MTLIQLLRRFFQNVRLFPRLAIVTTGVYIICAALTVLVVHAAGLSWMRSLIAMALMAVLGDILTVAAAYGIANSSLRFRFEGAADYLVNYPRGASSGGESYSCEDDEESYGQESDEPEEEESEEEESPE